MIAASIDAPIYQVGNDDDNIIAKALNVLVKKMKTTGDEYLNPSMTRQFCCLKLGSYEYEVFGVMFLNSQNRLICFDEMFRGTLNQTSVYPREVVKAALLHNAAAVIFTHNHPSGSLQPSGMDERLTKILKDALALVDVRVLDHIIVSGDRSLSMAEQGLI